MIYNSEIRAPAPLPSGALPTDTELRRLVARGRRLQAVSVLNSLRRIFRP